MANLGSIEPIPFGSEVKFRLVLDKRSLPAFVLNDRKTITLCASQVCTYGSLRTDLHRLDSDTKLG